LSHIVLGPKNFHVIRIKTILLGALPAFDFNGVEETDPDIAADGPPAAIEFFTGFKESESVFFFGHRMAGR
jgi:hypothetical protein